MRGIPSDSEGIYFVASDRAAKQAAGRNRREFRRYCKLAKKIKNEEFVRIIAEKAGEHIPGNCGKSVYLFRYVVESR